MISKSYTKIVLCLGVAIMCSFFYIGESSATTLKSDSVNKSVTKNGITFKVVDYAIESGDIVVINYLARSEKPLVKSHGHVIFYPMITVNGKKVNAGALVGEHKVNNFTYSGTTRLSTSEALPQKIRLGCNVTQIGKETGSWHVSFDVK